MPKSRARTLFSCQQCSAESPKWLGRCPDCGAWNSYVETVVAAAPLRSLNVTGTLARAAVVPLDQVAGADFARITVPIAEFDRVLGGGIVPGSLVLIGGDPGIGKSTLLIQAARAFAAASPPVLYVTAEESATQVKLRADRLGVTSDGLLL